MISVSGKRWEQIKINKNIVEKLKQDLNFNSVSIDLHLEVIEKWSN